MDRNVGLKIEVSEIKRREDGNYYIILFLNGDDRLVKNFYDNLQYSEFTFPHYMVILHEKEKTIWIESPSKDKIIKAKRYFSNIK